MTNTTIRLATLADESAVFASLPMLMERRLVAGVPIEHSYPARIIYRDLVMGGRGNSLVFEANGEVRGLITLSYTPAIHCGGEYARVEELIIDDEARGGGGGRMLVEAAIEKACQRGCNEIRVYAREHARAFYEKTGFRYVGPELHFMT
jgi:GNAT superfamily N-acetyltransferase